MRFLSWAVLGKRIKAIGPMLKDKNVSFGKKALLVFGFLYLFLPIDLIPAPVFFVAWVDDLILWIFILYTLREELDRYGEDEKEVELNEKFHGKNVIDEIDPENPSAEKKQ